MKKKIYFAASIRGGRQDASLYQNMIAYIKKTDIVLTEHIGNVNYSIKQRSLEADQQIYNQDMNWLKESDLVIAECTCPSLGVGYELATAEKLNKPVFIFYRKSDGNLSAMLTGDSYFHIYPYETEEDIYKQMDIILKD